MEALAAESETEGVRLGRKASYSYMSIYIMIQITTSVPEVVSCVMVHLIPYDSTFYHLITAFSSSLTIVGNS